MSARTIGRACCLLVLASGLHGARPPAAEQQPPSAVEARIDVSPLEATVGDRIGVTITVRLPPGTRLEPAEIGPELGRLSVVDGAWSGPVSDEAGMRWVWSGAVVSFRPGQVELPAVNVVVRDEHGERREARTEPLTISIVSVLDAEAEGSAPEIADLKPPASIPPDFGTLITAAGILGLLLAAAGLLWWLHRRYAARLAAVPAPDDPFRRTPPHEWVYAELQRLLDRRLAEQGQVDRFFAALAQVMKTYLGGRFRIELLERTTGEVPGRLRQAGAGEQAIEAVVALLDGCDRVKFARAQADSEACREAIESAYRIVDATRPRGPDAQDVVQGAA